MAGIGAVAAWADPDGDQDEEVMEGDTARRKTVRIPDSLPELTHIAAQHFGKGNAVRMYHLGKRHRRLHHPAHINWLNHDDHLVVEAAGPPVEPQATISTHKADFTAKPLTKVDPFRQDRESALSEWMKGGPLGNSRYREDFPPVPNSAREPAHRIPSSLRSAREAPTGTTSYKTHYPWKTAEKDPHKGAGVDSTLTSDQRKAPFNGLSSYNADYVPLPVSRVPPIPAAAGQKPLPADFCGDTTYACDYLEPKEDTRLPSARPSQEVPSRRPLLGMTEYVDQYTKKELKAPHVHLDPHTGRSTFKRSVGTAAANPNRLAN
mmetsp:Transcript_26188/g.61096  ORF Transcript_26188/g.61096 Transcript_26188/m.61096 type:complete len:320 (-) Transcript_26188:67-1026(-)|eukprot:CAMPEP_0178444556 /NCGR_PEP_ID=MMETSP0689_2-20121128/39588_1 /TAXON_ID=160604 /ORGANISM="Amphidinium massartii, Strain CS-259" /LENGTH=319 /DNA_ID=CAMNT_0020068831 /DNA_START=59 /DNA_END=1018 /DNA_ORIENTATION=+